MAPIASPGRNRPPGPGPLAAPSSHPAGPLCTCEGQMKDTACPPQWAEDRNDGA